MRAAFPMLYGCPYRRWRPAWALIGLWLIGFMLSQAAHGQIEQVGPGTPNAADSTANSAAQASAVARQIQEHIQQLGSEKFEAREAASAGLLAIGEPALIPLATAERSSDREVSTRAQSIRQRIERDRFESLAGQFKRDPDPTASYGLPGWKRFSQVAGTTRPAKRLFLEMLERRPIVALCLESLDGSAQTGGVFEGLPTDPQQRLRTVAAKTSAEIRVLHLKGDSAPGDLLALLISIQMLDDIPLEVHDCVRALCYGRILNRMMVMPGAGPPGRKMMGAWFKKAPMVLAPDIFVWSKLYRIPEGRDMARRVLDSPLDVETKAEALYCLSIHGTADDLAVIDQYVDRTDFIQDYNPPPEEEEADLNMEESAPPKRNQPLQRPALQYRRTLGDVALAAGYKLLGLELRPSFPRIRTINGTISPETIGFPIEDPQTRQRALQKYKNSRASK